MVESHSNWVRKFIITGRLDLIRPATEVPSSGPQNRPGMNSDGHTKRADSTAFVRNVFHPDKHLASYSREDISQNSEWLRAGPLIGRNSSLGWGRILLLSTSAGRQALASTNSPTYGYREFFPRR
jgi:hypothetical protein